MSTWPPPIAFGLNPAHTVLRHQLVRYHFGRRSIYFQVKGDPARILKAGDPFFEPAQAVVTHFDNASPDTPAKFVLNYLMDKEKEFIILLDEKGQQMKP
ncbi:hypothetical protein ACQ86N_37550 [Puia sp. P3]|uniref:hypothetical protein n=1 Tax=Puia sp. P3 TaxID=3423952 RepID=UPI003D663F12